MTFSSGKIQLENRPRSSWEEKEAQRRGKGASAIDSREYDFSGVRDKELDPCVYYEYARESARIIQSVERLREELRQLPAWNAKPGSKFEVSFNFIRDESSKIRGTRFDMVFFLALAQAKEFPRASWRKLKSQEKRSFSQYSVRAREDHDSEVKRRNPPLVLEADQNGRGLENLSLSTWAAQKANQCYGEILDQTRRSLLLPGFFIVDLSQPPPMIEEEFRKWLIEHHPKGTERLPERRGRKSLRDWLNALAAMRLRFYCRTLKEAKAVTEGLRDKEHGLDYSGCRSWDRACQRAVLRFRTVLGCEETDLPIHYSNGWRK
jgi:hypothetical protein